jgi:hypothetical protein
MKTQATSLALFLSATLSMPVHAAVVLIDQAKALAGNVTPGDTPGFPVTISRSGSYRLSSDLTVPDENTTGVEITVSNVSLDLNGFSILGPVQCVYPGASSCTPATGSGDGVRITGPANRYANIAIQNGTIRGMGKSGISQDGSIPGLLIDRVRLVSNRSAGVYANGALIIHSLATGNGGNGFSGNGINLQSSTAHSNAGRGLNANIGSAYGGNALIGNGAGHVNSGGPHQTTGNLCGASLCP